MKLSEFGEKFATDSGIVGLMDDLGNALLENPDCLADSPVPPLMVLQGANDIRCKKPEADQIVRALRNRGIEVPYMVKVARTAARAVGLEKEMDCILDIVESYWKEGNDVIPDDMGVIGIMDDAYCSLSLLQSVSDNYRLLTGKYLFPDDLSAANEAMQKIIGEPYISELDSLVVHTMKEACLIDSVKQLADEEKRLALDSDATIWNHGPVGQLDIKGLKGLGIV